MKRNFIQTIFEQGSLFCRCKDLRVMPLSAIVGVNIQQIKKEMSERQNSRRVWSQQQDKALKVLFQSSGINRWSAIASQLSQLGFSGRTGKQCRQRYNNHLDPNINREDWQPQEQKKLFSLHDQLGNKWAIISQRMGIGRTDNSIKNHFFSKLRKSIRRMNKVIQTTFKKDLRPIQTKVLYKILQACEERFKAQPICDEETSQRGCDLKNRILVYSSVEDEEEEVKNETQTRTLISDIIEFNRSYKRKPKRLRRVSLQGENSIVNVKENSVRRAMSNESCNSANSFVGSSSQEPFQQSSDQIKRYQQTNKNKQAIITVPVTEQSTQVDMPFMPSHHIERVQQGQEPHGINRTGEQMLDELGLLEESENYLGNNGLRKNVSHMSMISSQAHEDQFKNIFDDSEVQMGFVLNHLPENIKKESYEDNLFPYI